MAKSKSSKSGRRGHSSHLSTPSHRPLTPALSSRLLISRPVETFQSAPPLTEVEDRRTFHFDHQDRPALTRWGTPAQVTVTNRQRPKAAQASPKAKKRQRLITNRFGPKVHSQTKGILTFAAPDDTVVCIRRQRRKEVLHAKKKTGGSRRPGRRTWLSKISCRR